MKKDIQKKVLEALDDKIDDLKSVLEHTIVKHSDAAFDLKDLKKAISNLENKKNDIFPDDMLVTAVEDKE